MNVDRLIKLSGVAVLVMALNVVASFLYVAFYAYVINPGHADGFYQEYAQVAAPYCSIAVGIPLAFFFARWVGKWRNYEAPVRNAMTLWVIYTAVDVAVLAGAGFDDRLALLAGISHVTKGISAYCGGLAARRRRANYAKCAEPDFPTRRNVKTASARSC